jgi:hypothetical protein
MKHKKNMLRAVFLLLGLGGLHAQESLIPAGGETTGTGGSASYSLGQIVYSTHTGNDKSVTQGVQQPYEIYNISDNDENDETISITYSAYPNPTTDILNLQVQNTSEALSYQLYDSHGKVVASNTIATTTTAINTSNLPNATYFMEILMGDREVTKFKIIKN